VVGDAELAVRQLARVAEPRLRPVAVADPASVVARATVGALPLFGGQAALRHALHETEANAVVLVGLGSIDDQPAEALDHHLASVGGVDAYRLEVRLERVQGKGTGG